jgi:hypothetical protein
MTDYQSDVLYFKCFFIFFIKQVKYFSLSFVFISKEQVLNKLKYKLKQL